MLPVDRGADHGRKRATAPALHVLELSPRPVEHVLGATGECPVDRLAAGLDRAQVAVASAVVVRGEEVQPLRRPSEQDALDPLGVVVLVHQRAFRELLGAARGVLLVVEEVLPLAHAHVEAVAEGLLDEHVLEVERLVGVLRIAVRGKLHAVRPAGVEHVAEEVHPHAAELEAVFVLLAAVPLLGRHGLGRLVAVGEAGLHLPADVDAEIAVGAGEEEVSVVARGGAVVAERAARRGVAQDVADDPADLAGALLGKPGLAVLGLEVLDLLGLLVGLAAECLDLGLEAVEAAVVDGRWCRSGRAVLCIRRCARGDEGEDKGNAARTHVANATRAP